MGTLGLEHTLIQNEERLRYDEAGKKVLKHKEVLANILKYTLTHLILLRKEESITCPE